MVDNGWYTLEAVGCVSCQHFPIIPDSQKLLRGVMFRCQPSRRRFKTHHLNSCQSPTLSQKEQKSQLGSVNVAFCLCTVRNVALGREELLGRVNVDSSGAPLEYF